MSWLQSTVRCSGRCYCCIDERIAVGAGTAFGDVVVATKVSPGPENLDSIEQVITTQIDEGLKWLGRDHVDVIYLHHAVLNERQPERGRLAVEDGGARSAEFAEGDQCGQDEVLGDQRRWQYRSADRGGGEGVVSGCGTREYSRYQGLM
jgi:hypothetical protein